MESPCFHELIRLAQRGDQDAVERLLAAIRPYLLSVANRYADPARASRSASDLVQEAELRAWRSLEQFEGGPGEEEAEAKFRSWMVSIVRRVAIDLQRSRNTRKRRAPGYFVVPLQELEGSGSAAPPRGHPLPAGESPSASSGLRAREESRRVREAIERLPGTQTSEVLKLYYFDGLSLRQVAGHLGLPYHQVKEIHRAGIRFLEGELERPEPE